MIEPEMAFADLDGDMDIAEAMIKYIIRRVLERCPRRSTSSTASWTRG